MAMKAENESEDDDDEDDDEVEDDSEGLEEDDSDDGAEEVCYFIKFNLIFKINRTAFYFLLFRKSQVMMKREKRKKMNPMRMIQKMRKMIQQ